MSRELSVAVVQSGELTTDLETNLVRLGDLIREAAAPGSRGRVPDLIVLPELTATPYFCGSRDIDYRSWAQPIPGDVTNSFAVLAAELGVAIAFGLYERTPQGIFHNAAAIVDNNGALITWHLPYGHTSRSYRKLSLPVARIGGIEVDERRWFSPGQAPAVVDLAGTRIGCVICYDRSFPEYWAVERLLGAEIVIVIVSSLGSREDLFLAELRTRAMESQTWVVAANRAGRETLGGETADYFGLSAVVRPDGHIVAQAPAHRANVIIRACLALDEVGYVRDRLPLGHDRRADVLEQLATLAVDEHAITREHPD
ncbi:carbon-nitrogen hydrolase family protein [Haloechinothrix salitolerans]|uniref:Carbon-nitrogen hydrolase family protein n=1 Tax=Haloechinothrix salitolerans TaxID=926830 RepID=A0ABW2C6T8_9PSEU